LYFTHKAAIKNLVLIETYMITLMQFICHIEKVCITNATETIRNKKHILN
jgi:hypothetical protein